jgi:hypothetical protein
MTNVNEIIVPQNGYANLINDYMFKRVVYGRVFCAVICIVNFLFFVNFVSYKNLKNYTQK